MHEFSFFLLQNWLPVGIASIFFFLVGLLIAKLIWGRYAQRLSFAVEENLNLASQWNALGASQRDLFKKLRARWQADRDAWEARLAESEERLLSSDARIAQLTGELKGEGKNIPEEVTVDVELRKEVASLRAELEGKDAEAAELRAQLEEREEHPIGAGLSLASQQPQGENAGRDEMQSRIRDLEQDLIDTHDELHEVRNSYRQQSELVESLENRLIEKEKANESAPATVAAPSSTGSVALAAMPQGLSQLEAIVTQRSREIRAFREQLDRVVAENARLESELAESLDKGDVEAEAKALQAELAISNAKIADRDGDIASRDAELARAREQIGQLEEKLEQAEDIERRRVALQAELNDACHEMYDVRTALNERLDEIELLEARIDELDEVEESKERLEHELAEAKRELETTGRENEAFVARIAQESARLEEFEAIIEDRGAEVDDLSTELRQKREQIRLLKETLAVRDGELEALTDEARQATLALESKQDYTEGQVRRIADLEEALSLRYAELNEVRARSDEEAKAARHHAARADQAESELERRSAEFDDSDRRIASVEKALEDAGHQIDDLNRKLADSGESVARLESEVDAVSREKEEIVRELEGATRRVEQLEKAAAEREERISEFESQWGTAVAQSQELEQKIGELQRRLAAAEQGGGESRELAAHLEGELDRSREEGERLKRSAGNLERQIARLELEVAQASQNRDMARSTIEQLDSSLQSNDNRVLELAARIEEQEEELNSARGSIEHLEGEISRRDQDLAETKAEADELRKTLEGTVGSRDALEQVRSGATSLSGDDLNLESLQKELEERESSYQALAEQRDLSLAEIDRLRDKVAKRGQSIRDLQGEVSGIMMQRADRDNEIALLKGKLRAVEEELENARKATATATGSALSGSNVLKSLEEALQTSLSGELGDGEGTSLDELPEEGGHHALTKGEVEESALPATPAEKPQEETPTAPASGGDENEPVVYFEEGSAELTDESRQKIDSLAREIRRSSRPVSVSVTGFAGPEGTPEHTESLSARRADAVRERLLARGVVQSRLLVKGSGQDRRFTDARARRVELVLALEAMPEVVN